MLGILNETVALDFDIACAARLQQWKDEREIARLEAMAGGSDPFSGAMVEMIPQHA